MFEETKIEDLTQSQFGDMDEFVIKKTQVSLDINHLIKSTQVTVMLKMILALEMTGRRQKIMITSSLQILMAT